MTTKTHLILQMRSYSHGISVHSWFQFCPPFANHICPRLLARLISMFVLFHQLDKISVRVVAEADAD